MQEDANYAKAFRSYLRNGIDYGLEDGADPDGGYLAPQRMDDRIYHEVREGSPMRRLASVAMLATDALVVQEEDEPEEGNWTPKGVTATATPRAAKRTIPVHELYAQPKATQKLVDDASLDIEAWVAEMAADIFARKESEAFLHGTGEGMPHGILSYARQGLIEVRRSGLTGRLSFAGIIELRESLPENFAKKAWFIMNRSTAQDARLLRDGNGSYVWQPGLSARAPDTLAGVPVQIVDDMPPVGPGAFSVAIGDFQAGYQIVDRPGVRVLRDAFTEKPFVKFYTTKRVGGDVINPDAIKVLALAA